MKIENIAGIVVNVEEALLLLDDAKIEQEDDSYYVLKFDNQGSDLNVTVDYEGRLGYQCIFNETYSSDPYAENSFSFERLIEDLHDQHLEDVENWIISFLEEKFR